MPRESEPNPERSDAAAEAVQSRLARNPTVVSERFGEEAVLVHLGRGRYYSLDAAAARVWECLAEEPLEDDLLGTADGAAGVAAARAFLDRLIEEDLVRRQPARDGVAAMAPPPSWPAESPTLEVFTDLEDLLILDPIHDIGDAGWPAPREPRDDR